ncbi:MAG: MnmC family methyltransferase, partial [Pseudomonadota bacterium]|nr:MnmC family methyltransferase [Pseudomonadota bacterium]
AYLFHLQRVHEITGWQLLGLHNIHFYMKLMRTMREHILAGTWLPFYRAQRDVLDARDSYGKAATHVTKAAARAARRKRGRYEVIIRDDAGYIRDMTSGEVMHPGSDPAEEARSLYLEQSRLIEHLQVPADEPLVVWDVGLGAAANAMAAVLAAEALRSAPEGLSSAFEARSLLLVSFENDLDSLKLALEHPRWFKHLRHAAPRALLSENRWMSSRAAIDWRLLRGDFAARKFEAPSPDIIFFDPFSFRTDGALWTLAAFRELAQACAPKAVEIFTYTYSTSVRAAMLAAGFYVAKGRGTGPKAETTIGLSPPAAAAPHGHALLGQEWLAKWRRSDAQAPFGASVEDVTWHGAVLTHPQFEIQKRLY